MGENVLSFPQSLSFSDHQRPTETKQLPVKVFLILIIPVGLSAFIYWGLLLTAQLGRMGTRYLLRNALECLIASFRCSSILLITDLKSEKVYQITDFFMSWHTDNICDYLERNPGNRN